MKTELGLLSINHRAVLFLIIVAIVSLPAAAQACTFTVKNNWSETVWMAASGGTISVFNSTSSRGFKLLPGVSATTTAPVKINCGGPAVSPFVADTDFTGGGTITNHNPVDLSGVKNPAPELVYQTERVGNFTYTIPGFTAGSSHTVRLHFVEPFFNTARSRTFNVSINGTQVLPNFDIFATAGREDKAVIEQFTVNANSSGQYVIQFTSVVNQALVCGIEVE